MFKLERLEITGFKSFADYTEILFTGDGITAIVEEYFGEIGRAHV